MEDRKNSDDKGTETQGSLVLSSIYLSHPQSRRAKRNMYIIGIKNLTVNLCIEHYFLKIEKGDLNTNCFIFLIVTFDM